MSYNLNSGTEREAVRKAISQLLGGAPVTIIPKSIASGAANAHDHVFTKDDITIPDGMTMPTDEQISALVGGIKDGALWDAVRARRNELLAETDWWAVQDRQITPEQAAYRQALRDITSTFTSPEEVVFPTKP